MKEKKPRGRPPKYPMPEPLNVDMDTLAEVVLKAKPKEVWRYEQETGRKPSKGSGTVTEGEDEPKRQDLSDQEYWEAKDAVQRSFAILAARLGSQEEVGRLLRSQIEKNPLWERCPRRTRLFVWRYARLILRQAYRVNDTSES